MKPVRKNYSTETMPRFFDSFLLKDFLEFPSVAGLSTKEAKPAVNVKEEEGKFTVEVVAPGFKKEDFKVELEKNVLTISSEKEENKEEKNSYLRKEFSFSSFKRSFRLPEEEIDMENIKARYENGILFLDLIKQKERKPEAKKISVA